MKGFFKKEEVAPVKRKKYNIKKVSGCESCKQYTKCQNGKMGIVGTGENGILVVDGIVSSQEENGGGPYSGITQKYLRDKLDELDVKLEECWYVHSIRCFCGTDDKKDPSTAMKNGCRALLHADIKRLHPQKIIALGGLAVDMIYGEALAESRVNRSTEKFYGWKIPYQELGCWVYSNYSPRYIIEALAYRMNSLKKFKRYKSEQGYFWEHSILSQDDSFRIRDLYFKQYLKEAIQHKEPFKRIESKSLCTSVETAEEAIVVINSMNNEKEIAMDFETDRILAYHPDSTLLTISLATKDVSFGFNYFKDNPEFIKAFHRLMLNENVRKICAFIHMEYSWTRTIIGCDIKNVHWCTVLASHFLSPTISGGNSLKFNVLKYFGILYDAEVDPYISSVPKYKFKNGKKKVIKASPYDENRMKQFPVHKRNLYCAEDSLYTMWVYKKQEPIIKNDARMYPLYKTYLEGTLVFTKTRERGFLVNEIQLMKNTQYCEDKILFFGKSIEEDPLLEKWNMKNPSKPFNPASGDHLREFLFGILRYDTEKRTKKGLKSTDSDVLDNIGKTCPLALLIKDYGKYSKILSTLEGVRRNTVCGKIHPFIGVSLASTGRSNSNEINFQNLDVKDPEAVKLVRGVLGVEEGMEVAMYDFQALEVRGGYSIHGDETMKLELEDESIDSHSLMATRVYKNDNLDEVTLAIAKLKFPNKKTFTKDELKKIFKDDVRKIVKSTSFALAYGGSANRVFLTLWNEEFSDYHKQYFASIGMNADTFKAHCKTLFEFYWDRYSTLDAWRSKTWESYLTKGYVYSAAGFRINGIRSKTFITNAPIQGSSYGGVALLSAIRLNIEMEKRGYRSSLRLQIHDSNEMAIVPEEFFNGGLKELVYDCMVTQMNRDVPWLKIPMAIDGEFFLGDWSHEVKEGELKEAYGL